MCKKNPHIIYKVFNTKLKSNTVKVNLTDDPFLVGDEPLISANSAPTWVCKERQYGIRDAIKHGADIIILDDGLQDQSIHKDYSILVINQKQGFGNGLLIPAGPLRSSIKNTIKKVDSIFFYGSKNGLHSILPKCSIKTILVKLHAVNSDLRALPKSRFLAFSGIAHPNNFYSFLKSKKINVKKTISYPDHFKYKKKDLDKLIQISKNIKSSIITTEKDYVKIPASYRKDIYKLSVDIDFDKKGFLHHFKESLDEIC